jgi:hypothetical protein
MSVLCSAKMRVLLVLSSEDDMDCAMALVPNIKQTATGATSNRWKVLFMFIPQS